MVYEGERHRRVGHLGAVGHLAHVEVVADEKRRLHRRRRDDVHLEDEDVDERGDDRCENDCVDPLVDEFVGRAAAAPFAVAPADEPREEMREVEVDDDQFAQQQPQVARPDDEPQDIEEAPEDEAEPFVTQDCLDFFHVGVVRFVSAATLFHQECGDGRRLFHRNRLASPPISTGRPSCRRPACRSGILPR